MVNRFDQMDQKIKIKNNYKKKRSVAGPYACYLETREWVVIENSLKDLEGNQDIKVTTVPEYVTGYIVKKLRDEGLIKGKIKYLDLKNESAFKIKNNQE